MQKRLFTLLLLLDGFALGGLVASTRIGNLVLDKSSNAGQINQAVYNLLDYIFPYKIIFAAMLCILAILTIGGLWLVGKSRRAAIAAVIVLSVLTACATATPVPAKNSTEGFAIYFPAQRITANEILKTPLDTIQLEGKPILSLDDIAAYSQDTHTIALASSGYEKIKQLKVPTLGISFVVCVDRQPIYVGVFWASYSSQSFSGVVIDTLLVERNRSIRLQLGYPESPDLFLGQDRRSDPRIMQSLRQAGKLKNISEASPRLLHTATPQPLVIVSPTQVSPIGI